MQYGVEDDEEQAPAGSIAVSENTQRLVEGYFALKALGPTGIKGVSGPVNVYEVTGLGLLRTRLQRAASRGLSRFVGRDAEIAQMKRALDYAKSGHGQMVAAMAEPASANRGCSSSSRQSRSPDAWSWRHSRSRTVKRPRICR